MEKQLLNRIQLSINYIEEHLLEKIEIEDIAKYAFMSQSSFYLIFSNVLGTTVKDYIRKRRLSLSAFDLVNSNLKVLDIALKYQYCTSESYSRAFKKLFGISPKKYREKNLYTHAFPRVALSFHNLSGGVPMINREMNKEVILEKIHSISNGYILDIDIDHFDNINTEYGYHIGDKVLIEVPERVKEVLIEHGINTEVTRINNDEFAVIIKYKSREFIEMISSNIINAMKPDFVYDELAFNITVSIGISDFIVDCDDEEIIKNANEAMILAKRNGRNQFKVIENR